MRLEEAGFPPLLQDNHSRSVRVRWGLLFQHPYGQGKLIRVVNGSVFDVLVDFAAVRRPSASGKGMN